MTRLSLILLITLLAAGVTPARARENDETTLLNYPYALGAGWDAFHVEGRSVQLYRLPFSYRLRGLNQGDAWGLKLILPVSFGFHDFKVTDAFGREVTRNLETVSVVPGAEFEIPLRRDWLLKPFAELGFGLEIGGELAYIYSAGVKSLVTKPAGTWTLRFGSALDYSGSTTSDGEISQGFGNLELGLDARRPLNWTVKGRQVDVSTFLILRRFFDLEFARPDGEPVEIDVLYEIGFNFGTEPRFKVWKFTLPRIGLSYRFNELTSWRINFGFPF